MSRFWSDTVRDLAPYVPGEQAHAPGLIKLNTNENPYPPSARALAVLSGEVGPKLRLYPDPSSRSLKLALAQRCGLDPANIFVGNGSDEVLAFCYMAFFKGRGPLLFPDVSYSFYPAYARLLDVEVVPIPVTDDFRIDLEPYCGRSVGACERPGAIMLPNPNAPTGLALDRNQIQALLANVPDRLVVIDEAYVDFGAESAIPLVREYENLLVVQTFSKSRSLAGLRVGFAVGSAELITGLDRVKNSFNSYPIDRLAECVALAALQDEEHFTACRDKIIHARERTREKLRALGFVVLPSRANFLFASHPRVPAHQLVRALRDRRILVRHFDQPRIDQYLRISIGTPDEMEALVSALGELTSSTEYESVETHR